ncbi:MAG: Na+/Picotransporter [Firmicutes bacterium HGW-Firmicutes-8]|nr:MAG: Na+/Picotransporter [Firmicutes bacterium HGW-Firmicutes-8]
MYLFSNLLGGIGVFLLGMTLMANSLKSLAGDALRRILSRFTGGMPSAILSGAGITALVQSSSATTLTTIGFVSAGLLSFPQAVGVIFGSNLGTTSTGWLVSLIGFKLNISLIALPLVGLGVLLNSFSRGKYSHLGTAIAGFGLVFIGIDILREGMAGINIDPEIFPGAGIWHRLILVLIGAVMTFVMQSSSAAVVTTLAALHSGAIVLEQAAALVIGQNVGTTITAALASIGGSVPARRTALSHIMFNLITGIAAFLILPGFISVLPYVSMVTGSTDPAISLAAFHTMFNLFGVIMLVPVVGPFINLVVRLIPEKDIILTRHLDPSVAEIAPIAVEAVRRTLLDITLVVLKTAASLLGQETDYHVLTGQLDKANSALLKTRSFLGTVRSDSSSLTERQRHLSALHAIDHLDRLTKALREFQCIDNIDKSERLNKIFNILLETINDTISGLKNGDTENVLESLKNASITMADFRRAGRSTILYATAKGEISPQASLAEIGAMIWLDRLGYHIWRIVFHLADKGTDDNTIPRDF